MQNMTNLMKSKSFIFANIKVAKSKFCRKMTEKLESTISQKLPSGFYRRHCYKVAKSQVGLTLSFLLPVYLPTFFHFVLATLRLATFFVLLIFDPFCLPFSFETLFFVLACDLRPFFLQLLPSDFSFFFVPFLILDTLLFLSSSLVD